MVVADGKIFRSIYYIYQQKWVGDIKLCMRWRDGRENGFISEIGDLDDMADNILFLDKNRTMLEKYGTKCKVVLKKCNIDDYMDYLENVIKAAI